MRGFCGGVPHCFAPLCHVHSVPTKAEAALEPTKEAAQSGGGSGENLNAVRTAKCGGMRPPERLLLRLLAVLLVRLLLRLSSTSVRMAMS